MTQATADLYDTHGENLRIAAPIFRDYGGTLAFEGPIAIVKVFEDNSLVRAALEQPGQGRVLVVDGGGSMRCALVGDVLADLGVKNGWSGIVIYGCVRDSAALSRMPIGVKALGTNPRKSVKKGEGDKDIAVRFAEITITAGEYLYADSDGIVVASQKLG
ncbi:MAG: ribonuclease E activity regulator RraA [Gammaproteobacteria bacterium]|nr:ribonuclease E activity regulator RraA [Gammaproteobacteria bacterium]